MDIIIGPVPPYAEVIRSHPQEMLVYQECNTADRENAIAKYEFMLSSWAASSF